MRKTISPSSVKAIFSDFFNGKGNIMTPDAIGHGLIPRYANRSLIWELSIGEGFSREKIWGVTVLEINDADYVTKRHNDLCKGGFRSEAEAKSYIKELRRAEIGAAERV